MANDHILPLLKSISGLRVAQLVVAIVILGLSAYRVTWVAFDGDSLTLFNVIFSKMIIAVYVLVSTVALQAASYASSTTYSCAYYYEVCIKNRDLVPRFTTANICTYKNAIAAAAGLGGLEFILFIVTLIFTAIYLSRHRTAGGYCVPGRTGAARPTVAAGVTTEPNMSQQQQAYPPQSMSPQPYPQ
ncbi:hypothetical protein B0J14DRAFT_693700 [Halenospora varia]|nr:hypothetical protein B0J14DRAFT_693700 [Halenospora varia]